MNLTLQQLDDFMQRLTTTTLTFANWFNAIQICNMLFKSGINREFVFELLDAAVHAEVSLLTDSEVSTHNFICQKVSKLCSVEGSFGGRGC